MDPLADAEQLRGVEHEHRICGALQSPGNCVGAAFGRCQRNADGRHNAGRINRLAVSGLRTTPKPLSGGPGSVRSLTLMGRKAPSTDARIKATRNPREGETALDRSATLQLVIALARALKEIDKWVRPHLASQGLGATEFAVLEVLYHKGPLPLGEIRDHILVTGPSTTYIVKKLEQRGLMRRRPSGEDQRVLFGELTPTGR